MQADSISVKLKPQNLNQIGHRWTYKPVVVRAHHVGQARLLDDTSVKKSLIDTVHATFFFFFKEWIIAQCAVPGLAPRLKGKHLFTPEISSIVTDTPTGTQFSGPRKLA